jgi:hypothetical protein
MGGTLARTVTKQIHAKLWLVNNRGEITSETYAEMESLGEICSDDVKLIQLALDKVQWQDFVNTVMNL